MGAIIMPTKKRKTVRRVQRLDRAAMKKRETAIIRDLKAGALSYRMIAQKHHVSLPTVNAKARKANIRRPRGRRPAAATVVSMSAAKRYRARKRTTVRAKKLAVRRVHPRTRTTRTTRAGSQFHDAFRQMVLHYYPRITLKEFDRLAKMVAQAVK
jgi:hypothetical protein